MKDHSGLGYDRLTGLYDRWHLYVELQKILDAHDHRVICTIDLDGFKLVNEQYGAAVGDSLLQAIAQALLDVYPGATVCRLSGDEFAFILPPMPSSRYQMSMLTRQLFDRLRDIHVPGLEHQRLTFSIGSVYIDHERHFSPDAIYLDATTSRLNAKKHQGNFLSSLYGNIPDITGIFRILREDRQLYNQIADRLFRIHNQEDWIAYLNEGASLKGDMFSRNQGQLDDLLEYFRFGDLPDCEYELLFWMVVNYARSLDAFMFGMIIGDILLPYYEQCNREDLKVRSRLGHLYLLLADSQIAIYRMGDTNMRQSIVDLLHKTLDVCRGIPHDRIEFEPYFFALCELVGHYESLEMQLVDVAECDACYEELRQLMSGPDPIQFQDQEVVDYFAYLIDNARLFPIYRACFLKLKSDPLTDLERQELSRRIHYIRGHMVDGGYDMVSDNYGHRHMADFLLHLLFDHLSPDRVLLSLVESLKVIHELEYGTLVSSNFIVVAYLFMGASRLLTLSSHSREQKRNIAISGINILLQLLRKRENVANDHQLLFFIQMFMREVISTPVLSPADKLHYLSQSMATFMLDTYCHSKAVSAYVRIILTNIIDHCPHLLVGEGRPYETVEQVVANREHLLDFMDAACMLHDVGKMYLIPITGNAYRRLTDQEFDLIHRHPEAGLEMLSHEPAFQPFHPFVRTHHRWYDGTAGYPHKQPGEEHCPLHVLICLLSFCDSLEAATSRIGRNYRRAKTFLQILDEFYVEAGTRYSSEVLESVIGSPDTYYAMRQMVDVNWQDIYQGIFQQVVTVNTDDAVPAIDAQLPNLYGASAARVPDQGTTRSALSNLPLPEWLRQMDYSRLMSYAYSSVVRDRMFVLRHNASLFYYDVATDKVGVLVPNEDGTVSYHFGNHFSHQRLGLVLSAEGYSQVLEALHRVVNDPDYPRQGELRFEGTDLSRPMLTSYSCVMGHDGQVLAVVGQFEDYSTSRPRLLETIRTQNRYISHLDALTSLHLVTLHTDVQLQHFEMLKGFPMLANVIGSCTTTKQLIDLVSRQFVDPEYRDEFLAFCDPSTIDERLRGKLQVTFEYHAPILGWVRAYLLPSSYDEHNRLSHVLFFANSIEDEHRQKSQLSYVAHHDALTGVYNRHKGEELISELIGRGGTQVFAILDCDHFKRINDELSHLVGDKVLRSLGQVLSQPSPDQTAMRLGGDEFVVHICGEQAYRLVNTFNGVRHHFEQLSERIATQRFAELGGIAPTFSFGIVITDGSFDDLTFDELYNLADEALRQSKLYRNGTITISELRYGIRTR